MPKDGQTLVEKLTAQLTLEDRWVAPEDVRDLSVDVVSPDTYEQWFADADERFQENIVEEWGEVPDRPFAIPGVEFGNVLVTVQPRAGSGWIPRRSTTTRTCSRHTITTPSTAGCATASRPTRWSIWAPTGASSGSPARPSDSTARAHRIS